MKCSDRPKPSLCPRGASCEVSSAPHKPRTRSGSGSDRPARLQEGAQTALATELRPTAGFRAVLIKHLKASDPTVARPGLSCLWLQELAAKQGPDTSPGCSRDPRTFWNMQVALQLLGIQWGWLCGASDSLTSQGCGARAPCFGAHSVSGGRHQMRPNKPSRMALWDPGRGGPFRWRRPTEGARPWHWDESREVPATAGGWQDRCQVATVDVTGCTAEAETLGRLHSPPIRPHCPVCGPWPLRLPTCDRQQMSAEGNREATWC